MTRNMPFLGNAYASRFKKGISCLLIWMLLSGLAAFGSAKAADQPDGGSSLVVSECEFTLQPELIFCDDFEQDRLQLNAGAVTEGSSYYDFFSRWGRWGRALGQGIGNSYSMNAYYGFYEGDKTDGAATPPHQTWLKLAFGKTPDAEAFRPAGDTGRVERELYFRFYVNNRTATEEAHTRSTGVIASVYGYGDGNVPFLNVNVSSPDQSGTLRSELRVGRFDGEGRPIGTEEAAVLTGTTPVMSLAEANAWHRIELHVKLNDAGEANGVYELWVDGQLESSKTDLDWAGDYSEYGVNAVGLFNTNNEPGVPGGDDEFRSYDNLMLSRSFIGEAGAVDPDNAYLRSLKTGGGKLDPAFASTLMNYTVQADALKDVVSVTPVLADPAATIRVDGETVEDQTPILLDMSLENPGVQIEVTSRDQSRTNVYTVTAEYPAFNVRECEQPKADWIFCDDFEQDRASEYFERTSPDQFYRTDAVGLGGSSGMKAEFRAADGEQHDTGAIKLAFGRTPSAYLKPVDEGTEDYREIYFRSVALH